MTRTASNSNPAQSINPLRLASRVGHMPRSGIRAILDEAAGLSDVIHLEIGEPSFSTPDHIVQAAVSAAKAGETKYTSSHGEPSLREAIAGKLRHANDMSSSPDDIVVTGGGVMAVLEAMLALVEPGDEVLIPDPGWPNAEMIVRLVGAIPQPYPLRRENGYLPDLEIVRNLARRRRARVLVVNTPSNPCGSVMDHTTLVSLTEIAADCGLRLIADECYEAIVFEGEHRSLAALAPDITFSAFSFSKTYAMTGWRVGYLVGPRASGDALAKVHEAVMSCASSVSQAAARAALHGPQDCVLAMVDEYRANRDAAVAILEPAGVLASRPRGAFYALVDISSTNLPSTDFARTLLQAEHVAVAPGATFGGSADQLVRVSLAGPRAVLQEGLTRMVRAIQRHEAAA